MRVLEFGRLGEDAKQLRSSQQAVRQQRPWGIPRQKPSRATRWRGVGAGSAGVIRLSGRHATIACRPDHLTLGADAPSTSPRRGRERLCGDHAAACFLHHHRRGGSIPLRLLHRRARRRRSTGHRDGDRPGQSRRCSSSRTSSSRPRTSPAAASAASVIGVHPRRSAPRRSPPPARRGSPAHIPCGKCCWEAALLQAAVDRHLPALEAVDRHALARLLALHALARRLAFARADDATA